MPKKRGYNKSDDSTFEQKVQLRKHALGLIGRPTIMETHGGTGTLYLKLYKHLPPGIVFEKNPDKTDVLAKQRPEWAIYEADCVKALRAGAGAHLPVNFLDVDPHGNSFEAVDAFLCSSRPKVDKLVIVGTDGGRMRVKFTSAWCTDAFKEIVDEFGNDFKDNYLEAVEWFIRKKATHAGYDVSRFYGYYCGRNDNIVHYVAVLESDSF